MKRINQKEILDRTAITKKEFMETVVLTKGRYKSRLKKQQMNQQV